MADESKFIDYADDDPAAPAWLREQREQVREADVTTTGTPPTYEQEMRNAEIRLQHVHETVAPTGLTDDDVRRLEHPEEFPRVRTVITPEPAIVGRRVGIVDEYGTVWSGEPGTSEIVGDLIPRQRDEETSYLYLRPSKRWWRR